MGGEKCDCSGGTKLIFACAGAADVGAVADRAARKLTKEGAGRMFCTAGLGGRVSGILKTTEAADCLVALDGCGLDCVRLSLENAGFKECVHVRVTDLGFEKGQTEVNDDAVAKVAEAVTAKLTCC